jgi:hypothetical protein
MANDLISKALGERFAFTIKNTSGAAKVVAILAAYFDTLLVSYDAGTGVTKSYSDASKIVAAGFVCDHVIDDGTIATGLTCTAANAKMSIRAFREYIKMGGRVLVDMSVQANNVAAFNGTLEVVKCSPLNGAAPQYLPLTEFRSVDQTATDKVNVRSINLEMTYDTLMLLPIENGHEITISFKFS